MAKWKLLKAIGICERTEMSSGGVYALLTRVLGGKVGASGSS